MEYSQRNPKDSLDYLILKLVLRYNFCKEVFPFPSNRVKHIHNYKVAFKKSDHCLKLYMTEKFSLLAQSDLDLLPHLLSVWFIIECWRRAFQLIWSQTEHFQFQHWILGTKWQQLCSQLKWLGFKKKKSWLSFFS